MSNRWMRMPFSEAVEINPQRSIARGVLAPFVDMAALPAESPEVRTYRVRAVSGGGSRFTNGDTLFARITPCTENGKTGFVDCLSMGQVGTGSTEFIVLGPRHGLTLPRFVYYLAKNSAFRSFAISRMRGTSGRQRVPAGVFDDFEVGVPPIPEQRKIVAVLSSVDDAIDKIHAVIDQVEVVKRGLMQALLTRGLPRRHTRFTQTEIGTVPACWQVSALGDVLEAIEAGWSPKCKGRPAQLGEWGVLKVSSVSSGLFRQHENKTLHRDCEPRRSLEVRRGDVLVARASGVLGLVGRSAFVHETRPQLMLSDKTLRLRPRGSLVRPLFLKLVLEDPRVREQVLVRTTGSHMRNISQRALRDVPIPVPCLEEQEHIEMFEGLTIARLERERKFHAQLEVARAALMTALFDGRCRVAPES